NEEDDEDADDAAATAAAGAHRDADAAAAAGEAEAASTRAAPILNIAGLPASAPFHAAPQRPRNRPAPAEVPSLHSGQGGDGKPGRRQWLTDGTSPAAAAAVRRTASTNCWAIGDSLRSRDQRMPTGRIWPAPESERRFTCPAADSSAAMR